MTAFLVTSREHPQKPSVATRFGCELPLFLDGQHTTSVIVASLPPLTEKPPPGGMELSSTTTAVLPLRKCKLEVLAGFLATCLGSLASLMVVVRHLQSSLVPNHSGQEDTHCKKTPFQAVSIISPAYSRKELETLQRPCEFSM